MRQISLLLLLILTPSLSMSQSSKLPNLPTDNSDGFIVIAHRGASAYAPENTISAFRMAVVMEAEMIELDVSISKDGVPVVIHDETVDRTTSGKGDVSSFTLAELKKLETGSWFDKEFEGEPFPTLKEALESIKGKIAVNIEIKHEAVTNESENGIVDKCVKIVKELEMEDAVIFSSFDYRVMMHLNELAPGIPKAILYEKSQSGDMIPSQLVEKYKVNAFNFSHKQFSKEWETDLKAHNIPFFIYTVNDPELMKTIIKRGATGIFSDKPDVLKDIVDNL